MTLLADTSILIAPTADDFEGAPIATSVVCLGELHAGVQLARDDELRTARLRRLTAVLAAVPLLPIDHAVAARYGELRSASGRTPSNDLWIAATALAHDLLLVTRDERLADLPLVRTHLVR